MKVELLNYAQDGEELIEFASRRSHNSRLGDTGKFVRGMVKEGHDSVLEHATVSFLITGISRACSHQLVRHRLSSYTQSSQRYISHDNFEYVMPKAIDENEKSRQIFWDAISSIKWAYADLLDLGIKKEDARFILPNATITEIVMTSNLRQWRNIIKVRAQKSSQWEIQELILEILEQLYSIYPNVFIDLYDEFMKE